MQLADIRPTAFVQELDRIMANFERPRLTVVTVEVEVEERNPVKWRALQHDYLNDQRRHGCRCCRGTGEMLVYIDEPPEPCAKCQQANPWTNHRHDDVPF